MTHDRRTVFLMNKCQTSEGVDHFWNGWSKAHSFHFSRKSNPTGGAQESETTGCEPKHTFRFALAGTNTIGIVHVLCKKNCEQGSRADNDGFVSTEKTVRKRSFFTILFAQHTCDACGIRAREHKARGAFGTRNLSFGPPCCSGVV